MTDPSPAPTMLALRGPGCDCTITIPSDRGRAPLVIVPEYRDAGDRMMDLIVRGERDGRSGHPEHRVEPYRWFFDLYPPPLQCSMLRITIEHAPESSTASPVMVVLTYSPVVISEATRTTDGAFVLIARADENGVIRGDLKPTRMRGKSVVDVLREVFEMEDRPSF